MNAKANYKMSDLPGPHKHRRKMARYVQIKQRLGYGERVSHTDWRDATRIDLVKNATVTEKMVHRALQVTGIKYKFQWPIKTRPGYRFADFYLPDRKLFLEVDGPYHNAIQAEDRHREQQILAHKKYKNFAFVRVTDEQVYANHDRLPTFLLGQIWRVRPPQSR